MGTPVRDRIGYVFDSIRVCRLLMVTIAALLLTLQSYDIGNTTERRNVKLVVSEASQLHQQAESLPAGQRGEVHFRITLILDEILADHPRSLEAAMLKTGRLNRKNVDVASIRQSAASWEKANPALARSLRENGGQPVKQQDTPPVEDDRKEDARVATRTDDKPVRRNTDNGTRTVKLPPRVRNTLNLPRVTNDLPKVVTPPIKRGGPARKSTPQQVLRSMRRATVLLMFVVDENGKLTPYHLGTGFFVGPDVIVTNSHVAGAPGNAPGFWLAINELIGVREAKLISRADKETPLKIDAAAMRVVGYRSEHFLRFNEHYEVDEWIAISGYPGKATTFDIRYDKLKHAISNRLKPDDQSIPTAVTGEGRINNHFVDSASRATNLQYTMTTAGGNSGSPVANACAEVVGLHYSGTKTYVKKDSSSDQYVVNPSKYNQSIASREVVFFLRRIGLPVETVNSPCEVGG